MLSSPLLLLLVIVILFAVLVFAIATVVMNQDKVADACCRVYVDAEEKQLRETMDSLVREESWQPMEDAQQTNVLKSSSELFAVIKRSLTRCSKFVSTGAAMLQLCNAFQVAACSRRQLVRSSADVCRNSLLAMGALHA